MASNLVVRFTPCRTHKSRVRGPAASALQNLLILIAFAEYVLTYRDALVHQLGDNQVW